MPKPAKVIVSGLKELLDEGYLLIEQYSLYGAWDYIPKAGEPEYTPDSMREYLKQNIRPQVFINWGSMVEDFFTKNRLNYLRLKHKVLGDDARKQSKYPVAVFLRTMRVLESLQENPELLEGYISDKIQTITYPEITYKDGVIKQGTRQHRFNYDEYVLLFDLLWPRRKISNIQGDVIKEQENTSREEVFKIKGVANLTRLKDLSTGIRKSMKDKQISLRLKYPDGVFLEVIQKQ